MPSQPRHDDAPICLEITRGRTQHPFRPIRGSRFLLGSGSWCDLCLGGSLPPLHSVITVQDSEVWLERVAESPELLVNSRACASCELRSGDRITVGGFSLTLHDRREEQVTENLMAKVDIAGLLAEDEVYSEGEAEDLSQITASELADRLERDELLVEEFEQRREQGAAALLQEIQRRIREDNIKAAEKQPLVALNELKEAIGSLDRLAENLEEQSDSIPREEYDSAASSLIDFQQEMLSRLDGVLARVAQLRAKPEPRQDVA